MKHMASVVSRPLFEMQDMHELTFTATRPPSLAQWAA